MARQRNPIPYRPTFPFSSVRPTSYGSSSILQLRFKGHVLAIVQSSTLLLYRGLIRFLGGKKKTLIIQIPTPITTTSSPPQPSHIHHRSSHPPANPPTPLTRLWCALVKKKDSDTSPSHLALIRPPCGRWCPELATATGGWAG